MNHLDLIHRAGHAAGDHTVLEIVLAVRQSGLHGAGDATGRDFSLGDKRESGPLLCSAGRPIQQFGFLHGTAGQRGLDGQIFSRLQGLIARFDSKLRVMNRQEKEPSSRDASTKR